MTRWLILLVFASVNANPSVEDFYQESFQNQQYSVAWFIPKGNTASGGYVVFARRDNSLGLVFRFKNYTLQEVSVEGRGRFKQLNVHGDDLFLGKYKVENINIDIAKRIWLDKHIDNVDSIAPCMKSFNRFSFRI